MRAKEYLMQYLKAQEDLRQLDEEIEELRTAAEAITCPTDVEAIRSGVSDKVGNLASKIADITIEIMDKRTEAIELRQEIRQTIQKTSKWQYSHVLYARYIENKRWEEISFRMGYSFRNVTRMHGEALQEIEKLLK